MSSYSVSIKSKSSLSVSYIKILLAVVPKKTPPT
jgi:hypothetical protein